MDTRVVSLGGNLVKTDKPMREREDFEFYPTPIELCRAVLNQVLPANFTPQRIIDPGAGNGVWGMAAREKWPSAHIIGVEVRPEVTKPAAYDEWHTCSFADWWPDELVDLVMGNPPYGDPEEQEQRRAKKKAEKAGLVYVKPPRKTTRADAEVFVRRGVSMLRVGGLLTYLLRQAFLEGAERRDGLYSEGWLSTVDTCSERPSFIPDGEKKGKTDATAYAIFTFDPAHTGRYSGGWVDWKPQDAKRVQKRANKQLSLL